MTKDKKTPYETPTIIPLGELARGMGKACRIGSSATGQCSDGAGIPPLTCSKGIQAVPNCGKGSGVRPA